MEIEQQFVAITLDDGSTAIMGFATQARGSSLPYGGQWVDEAAGWWRREPTDDNIFQEIGRTSFGGAQPVSYRKIKRAEIPRDRSYRNALVDDGGQLTFDMPKAREIHRDKLRQLRVAHFAANDIVLLEAVIEGDEVKRAKAVARRDALRDVTELLSIEAAKTIEQLKTAGMEIVG